MTYRCPLSRFDPIRMDAERVKRDGWRVDRILVVALTDQRLTDREREIVRNLGEKLYGSRA